MGIIKSSISSVDNFPLPFIITLLAIPSLHEGINVLHCLNSEKEEYSQWRSGYAWRRIKEQLSGLMQSAGMQRTKSKESVRDARRDSDRWNKQAPAAFTKGNDCCMHY